MTSNKLLEQIVEYYVRQYNAVVTFNSNSAKTIVIGEMTIRLQQVFDDRCNEQLIALMISKITHSLFSVKRMIVSMEQFEVIS